MLSLLLCYCWLRMFVAFVLFILRWLCVDYYAWWCFCLLLFSVMLFLVLLLILWCFGCCLLIYVVVCLVGGLLCHLGCFGYIIVVCFVLVGLIVVSYCCCLVVRVFDGELVLFFGCVLWCLVFADLCSCLFVVFGWLWVLIWWW